MTDLPERVRIVEVGPRDGLQNEARPIPTARKVAFIDALVTAGLSSIEVTSFVRPIAVPQLADAKEVVAGIARAPNVTFSALVPNMEGLERAAAAGIRRIAVFTAASETFAQRNINMTIARSLEVFREVIAAAAARAMTVRGYVSTCFTCPYEGRIGREAVRDVAERLIELGVDEVAVSDTIGAAAPNDIEETVGWVLRTIPRERVALHLHDTYGTALVNVHAALGLGITTFDASAGGLGGCPYAPGAAGNLATEDLVYLLDRLGIATGVDLEQLFLATRIIAGELDHELPGKLYRRMASRGGEMS